jgi:hypothetical protein
MPETLKMIIWEPEAQRTSFEPDMKVSRIRLSDKTSRLHPRHVVPKPAQAQAGRADQNKGGNHGRADREGRNRHWGFEGDWRKLPSVSGKSARVRGFADFY